MAGYDHNELLCAAICDLIFDVEWGIACATADKGTSGFIRGHSEQHALDTEILCDAGSNVPGGRGELHEVWGLKAESWV